MHRLLLPFEIEGCLFRADEWIKVGHILTSSCKKKDHFYVLQGPSLTNSRIQYLFSIE